MNLTMKRLVGILVLFAVAACIFSQTSGQSLAQQEMAGPPPIPVGGP